MDMHLLVCPCHNMLTLRARLSLQVSTYLLHKRLPDCSTTYTMTPAAHCTLQLLAYVHARLLACLLPYLPTYFLTCLLAYLLAVAARELDLRNCIVAHLRTYESTYTLT